MGDSNTQKNVQPKEDSSGDVDAKAKTQMEAKEAAAPPPKRSKWQSLLDEILQSDIADRTDDIRSRYKEATPYPHTQIQNLMQTTFIESVKDEIKSHTKVNFKESDLFRVYQSIDLANLKPGTLLAEHLPNVMKLRELLYSQEWRSLVERWAHLPPSTLTDKIDCACNCHAPGCHLLCHDDVIGSRKVSYIIYLTEDDWEEEEGGSLELYAHQGLDDPTSKPLPLKRVWPTFNSMAFFVVDPGKSFHAVQEVVGTRPRLSLQGWYHAAEPPANLEQATLQQLKALRSDATEQASAGQDQLLSADDEAPFTEEDREFLSQYLHGEYLSEKSMEDIATKFEEDSSVQLRDFFLAKWAPKQEYTKQPFTDDYYNSGITADWTVQGPAHMQRYLEYKPQGTVEPTDSIESLLHQLRTKVMESKQLARFFKRVTSLHCESIQTSKIRRFRPGLDYTVAHYGLLVDKPVLDATVCFVNDDNGDDKQAWESGDVGGFECYIAADDEDEKEGAAKGTEQQHGPADEYNEDDDTQLLSVSPSNNTLNLVYRDPGTLRFVKYVSHSAPSSRYDISMEYTVTDDDDEDEDDGGEDADQEQKTAAENDGDKKPKAA